MKRVLLASSALCLGAGMATAQDMGMDDGMMEMAMPSVTIGGDGRMGVVFDDDENAKFSSRVRVSFTLAAALDNGMTAGGSIRADNASGGAAGTGGSVFLEGPFGKLSMGDVDPGAKAALGHVAGVGFTGLGDLNEITYTRGATAEDPTLQYKLPMMGPVQAYASVGMETMATGATAETYTLNAKTGEAEKAPVTAQEVSFETFSVGAKADLAFGGDAGTAWIGGGFEGTPAEGNDGHLVVGAGVSASGFSGTLLAGTSDDADQFGVSAGYSAGVIGATVFYTDDTEMPKGKEALGVGLEWSLGGGASLKGGVVTDIGQNGADDARTADLGVTFSF